MAVGDVAEHWEQPGDDEWRQPEAELVDEQQPGCAQHGPGDGEHLLLSTRQQPGRGRQASLQLGKQLEGVGRLAAAGLGDGEVLAHGEPWEQAAIIGDHDDACPGELGRVPAVDALAEHLDVAVGRS